MRVLLKDEQVAVAASTMSFEKRHVLATKMSELLASTYTLYLSTQCFHWNVKGQTFLQLHELFEVQYREIADAIDEIAESIVMLGYQSPGTFGEFDKLSFLSQNKSLPDAESILIKLDSDHCTILEKLHCLNDLAVELKAGFISELIGRRQAAHTKHAWMLQSTLGYQALPLNH